MFNSEMMQSPDRHTDRQTDGHRLLYDLGFSKTLLIQMHCAIDLIWDRDEK